MATLEERTISGKGLLRVPSGADIQEARILTLYADVFRRPVNEYLNFNYNPPKSRYATLNFFRDSYLLRSEAMEFPSQTWDFYPELNYQNLYALDCVYEGILQTFVNLGVALNLTPISVQNNIALFRHTSLWFDEIKVVCYGDTAIKLRLESKPYDFCPDQEDYVPDPPPPPPDEVAEFPRGQALPEENGVSLPYDGSTFDNGDTAPYELDEFGFPPTPPGEGNVCESTPIALNYEQLLNDGVTWAPITANEVVYAQYNLTPVLVPSQVNPERVSSIQMYCQGIVAPGLPCSPYDTYQIRNLGTNGQFVRNVSISLR